jgi:hypothetical protein
MAPALRRPMVQSKPPRRRPQGGWRWDSSFSQGGNSSSSRSSWHMLACEKLAERLREGTPRCGLGPPTLPSCADIASEHCRHVIDRAVDRGRHRREPAIQPVSSRHCHQTFVANTHYSLGTPFRAWLLVASILDRYYNRPDDPSRFPRT